jgi:hypothetical protein
MRALHARLKTIEILSAKRLVKKGEPDVVSGNARRTKRWRIARLQLQGPRTIDEDLHICRRTRLIGANQAIAMRMSMPVLIVASQRIAIPTLKQQIVLELTDAVLRTWKAIAIQIDARNVQSAILLLFLSERRLGMAIVTVIEHLVVFQR